MVNVGDEAQTPGARTGDLMLGSALKSGGEPPHSKKTIQERRRWLQSRISYLVLFRVGTFLSKSSF